MGFWIAGLKEKNRHLHKLLFSFFAPSKSGYDTQLVFLARSLHYRVDVLLSVVNQYESDVRVYLIQCVVTSYDLRKIRIVVLTRT